MSSNYSPGGRHIFGYLNVIRREEPVYDESFDPNDLSNYTEAKFFDFDMGQPADEAQTAKKDTAMSGNEPAIVAIDLTMKGGEMDFIGMAAHLCSFLFPIKETPRGWCIATPRKQPPHFGMPRSCHSHLHISISIASCT